jgi:hypothetical protein
MNTNQRKFFKNLRIRVFMLSRTTDTFFDLSKTLTMENRKICTKQWLPNHLFLPLWSPNCFTIFKYFEFFQRFFLYQMICQFFKLFKIYFIKFLKTCLINSAGHFSCRCVRQWQRRQICLVDSSLWPDRVRFPWTSFSFSSVRGTVFCISFSCSEFCRLINRLINPLLL